MMAPAPHDTHTHTLCGVLQKSGRGIFGAWVHCGAGSGCPPTAVAALLHQLRLQPGLLWGVDSGQGRTLPLTGNRSITWRFELCCVHGRCRPSLPASISEAYLRTDDILLLQLRFVQRTPREGAKEQQVDPSTPLGCLLAISSALKAAQVRFYACASARGCACACMHVHVRMSRRIYACVCVCVCIRCGRRFMNHLSWVAVFVL